MIDKLFLINQLNIIDDIKSVIKSNFSYISIGVCVAPPYDLIKGKNNEMILYNNVYFRIEKQYIQSLVGNCCCHIKDINQIRYEYMDYGICLFLLFLKLKFITFVIIKK